MITKKKKSLFNVFLKGILSTFSTDQNPIKELYYKRKGKTDAENMMGDWSNVGNDIRSAYGKFKAAQ